MDKNMEILWSKLEDKLNQQTLIITNTVTINVTEVLNEKLESLTEENKNLKLKISELEQKLQYLDKDKRKNNLVFFGVEENGKREIDLVEYIKKIIVEAGTPLDCQEVATSVERARGTSIACLCKLHNLLNIGLNFYSETYTAVYLH